MKITPTYKISAGIPHSLEICVYVLCVPSQGVDSAVRSASRLTAAAN